MLAHLYGTERLRKELDRRMAETRWIVDFTRTENSTADDAAFQRALKHIDATPGDEFVTLIKRGGYFGLSRYEMKNTTHLDDATLLYLASEGAQVYLE
jgi:hypothetical protein